MAERVLMLGFDAIVPPLLEKFVEESLMPNFRYLMENGCFTRLLSAIPAQTPANWQSIATGATPGSHGVTVWGGHQPGDPIPETHREEAFSSGLCRAEYFWEAAARAGRKSVVMNYAGYPPTAEGVLHIDGVFRPSRSRYDISEPTVYHNLDSDRGDPVEIREARGWENVPESSKPPMEMVVEVPPATKGTGPSWNALLLAKGKGYDTLLLCTCRNAAEPVLELKTGEMSEWLNTGFDSEETGKVEGAMRFKLVECSEDASAFRLYRSEVFPVDGRFASDAEFGRRLIDELGPYVHTTMTAELHMKHGLLDWETVNEAIGQESVWWSEAARIAMEETGAEVLYLHWHLPDMVGHEYSQYIDPTGGGYEPGKADHAWEDVRRYYRVIDRFAGEFVKRFDLEKDVIAVTTDHGMPANKKAVALVNAFRDTGWLVFNEEGTDVDWAKSKVFFDQNHLWISLKGREPNGIVAPEEYEQLRAEVQAAMRDIKDPDTGEHVFSFVLTREEAPLVGLWGDQIGDLVFCYAGGYRWSGSQVLRMNEERVVFPCGGGNHGPMIPTYETDVSSVYAMTLIAGAGVKEGIREKREEWGSRKTVDVPATLAALLGIDPPAQNEGRVMHEFLEGREDGRPQRTLKPMGRNVVSRIRRRKEVQLQGDVTDEV